MTPDLQKTFLTNYLLSLKERTRIEATGPKWGIDWVIYNLGQVIYGKPVRLPFVRLPDGAGLKSKTEGEFGVDVGFIDDDSKTLTVFVLKSEPLTNKTWIGSSFHEDLSKAISPDLRDRSFESIERVEVILAYNRDDYANGIQLFDRFVSSAPKRLADRADLVLSRWNLSDLVDLTLKHLLTPALLPELFYGQINYLSSQVADFKHGSDSWEQQLLPGWKRFVDDALVAKNGERGFSLIPIALIILREHGSSNPSIETGLIDLTEIAAIKMWARSVESDDKNIRFRVVSFWNQFYLTELERFYRSHIGAIATENSIDSSVGSTSVGVVAASVKCYWHIGRIGILSTGLRLLLPDGSDEQKLEKSRLMGECANWMIQLINANESALRPVLDIHHIEVALIAFTFGNASRMSQFGEILPELIQRLFLRRIGFSEIPFLDGYNSLRNVLEQVAMGNVEKLITDKSSFFVLMLMELSCLLDADSRDTLLQQIHRRLVMGAMDSGSQREIVPLDLMSWIPPASWANKVLNGYVDDGETVSLGPLSGNLEADGTELHLELTKLVSQMRAADDFPISTSVPFAALLLACIRHQSPLPPEVWRTSAFPLE